MFIPTNTKLHLQRSTYKKGFIVYRYSKKHLVHITCMVSSGQAEHGRSGHEKHQLLHLHMRLPEHGEGDDTFVIHFPSPGLNRRNMEGDQQLKSVGGGSEPVRTRAARWKLVAA